MSIISIPVKIVILVVAMCASTQWATGQSVEGHVTLSNGDRLPALIGSVEAEHIEFKSPLFLEQVKLESQFLGSFGFNSGSTATPSEDQPVFQFRFRNQDQLIGTLESLDEKNCVLDVMGLGKVTAATEDLVAIVRQSSRDSERVFTPVNWKSLKSDVRLNSMGRVELNSESTTLKLPDDFEDSGRVSLDFLSNNKTEFEAKFLNQKGNTLCSIGVTNDTMVVEAGSQLEFGEPRSIAGCQKLTFDWDGKKLRILNHQQNLLAEVRLKSASPLSVGIENTGSPLEILELTIGSTQADIENVSISQLPPGKLWQDTKGETASFESMNLSKDNLTAVDGAGKTTSLPLNQVQQIWLADGDASAKSSTQSNTGFVAYWKNQQRAHLSEAVLRGGQLSLKSNQLDFAGELTDSLPDEVFVSSSRPSEKQAGNESPEKSQFRLAISGIPFSGTYQWGDSDFPIRWQFDGFVEPVKLNIQRKIEIRRTGSTKSSIAAGETDRLVLSDGSIVPCTIETGSPQEVTFKSSRVESQQVPLDRVRCCIFNSDHRRWKKLLTNETVQRALVLPRFSRDVNFTHVLIGRNGDLLRGNFLGLTPTHVSFESRLEPLTIRKSNVAGIVSIDLTEVEKAETEKEETSAADDPNAESETEQVNVGESGDSTGLVARVDGGNDFIAVGQYVELNRERAILQSPTLGRLTIAGDEIRQIAINSQFGNASDLMEFADWRLNTSVEPRWSSDVKYAADANELLNQEAPDFEVYLIDDSKSFSLSDNLGKVIVLQFWESTSRPCVVGIPELRKTIEKFSPQKVSFLAVNQGETDSTISEFIQAQKWSAFDTAIDTSRQIAQLYKVTAIPQTVVIDRSGIVHQVSIGYSTSSASELQTTINELLK